MEEVNGLKKYMLWIFVLQHHVFDEAEVNSLGIVLGRPKLCRTDTAKHVSLLFNTL